MRQEVYIQNPSVRWADTKFQLWKAMWFGFIATVVIGMVAMVWMFGAEQEQKAFHPKVLVK